MAIYTIGEVIKRERLAQGITQEALAENICSVSWLSKIESGIRTPTPQIFELLMSRMGKKASHYVMFKSDREMEIGNLKQKINACYRTQKIMEGRELLKKFSGLRDESNPVDLQFELLSQTLLYEGEMSLEARHDMLIKAINVTLSDFDEDQMMDYLLASEEIVIINSLGDVYRRKKDYKHAIELFKKLLMYLERPKFDIEEKKRIYTPVSYNIATLTGYIGDYQTSLYYADKGIRFAVEYNILRTLPKLLYSKGAAYACMGERKEAIKYLTQAYHLFCAISMDERAATLKERCEEEWGFDIN